MRSRPIDHTPRQASRSARSSEPTWRAVGRCAVALIIVGLARVVAADAPAAREIPVPPVTTTLPAQPGLAELPRRTELPDPLTLNDGARVTNAAQWARRRNEIRSILEYYAVGRLPPAPDNLRAEELHRESVLDGAARYRLLRLTFGPEHRLTLDIGLFMPLSGRPCPVIIMPTGIPPEAQARPLLPAGPGQGKGVNALLAVGPDPVAATAPVLPLLPRRSAGEMAETLRGVLNRGFGYVVFNYTDCGEDTTLRLPDGSWAYRTTRFFPSYPGCDWGLLGSWAWGMSRVVDYLVTDPAVDPRAIVAAGFSRTAKAAIIAGAFDERIALTAPVVSGGGGVGAYRLSGAGRGGKEGLDEMMRKYPNWFSPHLHQFRGHVEQLPFDQHWFLALMAPRGFLALEGESDGVSLASAVRGSVAAARPVYELLQCADRLDVHYAPHGHEVTPADWAALIDFADRTLPARTPVAAVGSSRGGADAANNHAAR